ncbi:Nucleoporin-like protein 2 [Coemansia sp. RSA 2336]|nr:Nucleoporin-like protein 2 [Coemansia sp. RSA 2336]
MPVCQYFLQGRCSFGDRCRNEHPQNRPSGFGQSSQLFGGQGGNRFGALSGSTNAFKQTSAFGSFASNANKPATKNQVLTGDLLKRDIGDRPLWRFSVYGPTGSKPNILSGTDISPEEMHLDFKMAEASGNVAMCQQKYAQLDVEMDQKLNNIVQNADSMAQQWERQYGVSATQQGGGGSSAFGQSAPSGGSSAFGQSATLSGSNAFGQSASSGSSAFGQKPSAFGGTTSFGQKPSAFGGSNTFGQTSSAFGSSGTSAFGQSTTTSSAFGQSKPAFGGAFGQSTTGALGQPKSTSAFGGQSALGGFGQGTSAFGQSAGTQPPSMLLNGTSTQKISGTTDPTRELSQQDIEQYKAPQFTMGQIPEIPPTADLL